MTQAWKLSIGTAGAIGLRHLKTDAPPTTAYLMLGERCSRNCAFCAQARESTAGAKFLSRVAWHEAEEEASLTAIGEAWLAGKIKRVCLQVVSTPESLVIVQRALREFQRYPGLPVVVSSHFTTVEQAAELFSLGAARLGLALDAATPELFSKVKGGSFAHRWQLLCACADRFPDRMTTHLIVGLGETEREMWDRICACVLKHITVALFAFTPLPGTPLAKRPQPDRSSYRRLQIGLELLRLGLKPEVVECDQERITGLRLPQNLTTASLKQIPSGLIQAKPNLPEESFLSLRQLLSSGRAFQTCGCPDCNRPYYNDHPRQVLYNYHRPLTKAELELALQESGLVPPEPKAPEE